MPKRITYVPFPGNSGATPTGALQFQNNWPGLFIRGDDAFVLHSRIRNLQQRPADHPNPEIALSLLQLEKIADIIERDVVV